MFHDLSRSSKPDTKRLRLARIRASRCHDNRKECERRLAAFGLFGKTFESDAGFALRIARALRMERRAARTGGPGYDPMRHLVLLRLDRRLRQRKRINQRSILP